MKCLVTGGGGFLGKAIARKLVALGHEVQSICRNSYPELENLGITHFCGDICREDNLAEAAAGCEIVFHTAAKAGVWGGYRAFHQVNVQGTRNVINVCRKNGIRKLVYTSSPSVVFDGTDMEGLDESIPYPRHYDAHYPRTKALAEQMVLKSNGPDLTTVSLRPHLIWGPEDNHLVPRILARGKSGQLRKIGGDDKKVDAVYIDNAAQAHILAGEKLAPGSIIAGKAYFITNDEPIPIWELINRILNAGGVQPVHRSISPKLAFSAGWLLELIYGQLKIKKEPRMTRFVAKELSTSHWFDISAAKRDLGYQPEVSTEEGLKRLADWLKTHG